MHTYTHTHTHTYDSQYSDSGWAKEINKFGTAVSSACQGKLSACHFGHGYH